MEPSLLLTHGHWFALAGLALFLWCGWHLAARSRPEPSTAKKALGAAIGGALALIASGGYGAWCLKQVRASAPHPPWSIELGALTPQRHAIILAEYNFLQGEAKRLLPEGCLFTCAEHHPVERSLVERLIVFERVTGLCNPDPLVPLAVLDPAHTQRVADRLMQCMPNPSMRSLALARFADDDLKLASDLYQRASYQYDIAPNNGEWSALAREVEIHWLAGEWQRAADMLGRSKLPSESEQRRVDCARDALLVLANDTEAASASARLKAAPKHDNTCLLIAANLWPKELRTPLDALSDQKLTKRAAVVRRHLLTFEEARPAPGCRTGLDDYGALAWSPLVPAAALLVEAGRRALEKAVTPQSIPFQHCAAVARAQLGDRSTPAFYGLKPSGDMQLTLRMLSPWPLDDAAVKHLDGDVGESKSGFYALPRDMLWGHHRMERILFYSTWQSQHPDEVKPDAQSCTFVECLLAAQDARQKPALLAKLQTDLMNARHLSNPEERLFELCWARWLAIALDEKAQLKSIERSIAATREHGLEWRLAAVLALLDAGPAGLEKPN
ncbi:MAG: hypothetical protein H6718_09860 [Polyangiaceae bacterium]|nr:hypothetical protein [Polyangiaceae bacterium]MCB9607377.1 hypothetical protein [Polyangiaceae bacterium]